MTLQEAIKSGKRFRRKGDDITDHFMYNPSIDSFKTVRFSPESVLATDWEIEPEKKEFTWGEILTAIGNGCWSGTLEIKNTSIIKRELGFE